ncbi:MAG: hypothetical protein QOE76_2049 [Frankiales bacterium]|jgi:hypothetical protein|nr:hypothetical protein [Frankiales bacterium]
MTLSALPSPDRFPYPQPVGAGGGQTSDRSAPPSNQGPTR